MNSKLLLIGGSGLLGRALVEELSPHYDVIPTYRSRKIESGVPLDLDDYTALGKLLNEVNPGIVILAAANPRVDRYESNPEISHTQIASAEFIVNWCNNNAAVIVFISSDAVFDGNHAPYSETDAKAPVSVYGKNKADIEEIVQQYPLHLILRVSVLYGIPITEGGFINKAMDMLSRGEEVKGVVEWIKTPTLTNDIGIALHQLLEQNARGIFHVAGADRVSMFEAAKTIADEFNCSPDLVKPISFKDLNLPAARGPNTSLSIDKLQSRGIPMRLFADGVRYVFNQLQK
jgi:dTDP-4-dehydrorhamnose reductase